MELLRKSFPYLLFNTGKRPTVLRFLGNRYLVAAFDPSIVSHSGAYLADAALFEEGKAEHARSQVSVLHPFEI